MRATPPVTSQVCRGGRQNVSVEANRDHYVYSLISSMRLSKKEFALVKGKASQAAEERPSRPVEDGAVTSNFAEVARVITCDDKPAALARRAFQKVGVKPRYGSRRRRQSAHQSKKRERGYKPSRMRHTR
jgi:hypothetical protein